MKKKVPDPDKPVTAKEWNSMGDAMRGINGLPEHLRNAVMGSMRGRPKTPHPKERVTLRLDADIVLALRGGGSGWQTRINALLRQAVTSGQI